MSSVKVSNVLAVVLALLVGRYCSEPGEIEIVTRVDTIAPAAMRDSLSASILEADGLRAKLAGRGRVAPRVIIRTDTVVTPPDTVVQIIALDAEGNLSLAPLIRHDSLWAPELHRFDVGNCDDGYSWAAGELVCDRARWGHVSFFGSVGALYPLGTRVEAGIEWRPSYRSGWRVSTATDPIGRINLTVVRGWRIF